MTLYCLLSAAPNDYTSIFGLLLVFNDTVSNIDVIVPIVDNGFLEYNKTFSAKLSFVNVQPKNVFVSPSTTNITIIDNHRMY